ncbi:hypothetical protein AMECASPLE_032038 [Ameca splendens]|uniref:Uncharacterized protein n=1 Tax=Ameca splendens TaxID=208324 RepID=A0ABV1A1W7_9TELE
MFKCLTCMYVTEREAKQQSSSRTRSTEAAGVNHPKQKAEQTGGEEEDGVNGAEYHSVRSVTQVKGKAPRKIVRPALMYDMETVVLTNGKEVELKISTEISKCSRSFESCTPQLL